MILSKTVFLYFFLPVFMGVYVLFGAKKRPWLISAVNLMFIALSSLYGLIVFAAELALAYFSAIVIYNDRNSPEKSARRRVLLAANQILSAASFVCFAHTSQFALKPLAGVAYFGAAVIPLHAVSYVTDVYRGSCDAQTRISSLAAYLGFFPSAGFGPILKYRNFHASFEAPSLSHKKASEGIRCYIYGLAEYVLIARQLENVWDSLLSTGFNNLRGASVWLGIILFCIMYSVKFMGLLNMGRGIALLMGFPVKQCFRRRIFKPSVARGVRMLNIPLFGWIKDYFYRPAREKSGTLGGVAALLVTSELTTLWYGFGVRYAAAGLILFAVMLAERELALGLRRMPKPLRSALSTLLMILISAAVCVPQLAGNHSVFEALRLSSYGVQSGFFSYLLGISVPLMIAGLVVMNGLVPCAANRSELSWYRAALPVFELLLIIFCTAFMIMD